MTEPPSRRPRHGPPRPSSAVIARRRLVVGGGALLGLGAIGYGVRALTSSDPAPVAGPGPTASASATPSGTPSASASPSPVASPSPTPVASAATARLVEAPRLADRVEELMERRGGALGLEVVDLRRGEAFRVETSEAYCYSTIKVLVLTTMLRQAQEADAELTGSQVSRATAMITHSDNGATESLLAEVGRDEVRRVADLVGMRATEIDSGWWGLWRTCPSDLDLMVDALVSDDHVLDGSRRATARFLMADVTPRQRWGVFAAERDPGVHVAGKNGWGPLPDGYRVNTTGWVSGEGSEYVLSILSRNPRGFTYGRETVGQVAALCHEAVATGLA